VYREAVSVEPPSIPAARAELRLLPRLLPINSVGYHLFLGAIAIFVLGPLGGVTAAYMNFSLGFFVGGRGRHLRLGVEYLR
jgi:hypothetical protein